MTTLAQRPAAVSAPCTVSVVICCYTMQRWRLLNRAVESVRRQSAPAHQIVLVVDHCPDLLELARSEIEGVEVVANTRAPGLSGARNCGVDAARGDVVAFLDDDAMADGQWLEHLGAAFDDDPSVLGVGGAVVPQWAGGQRPRWFPAEYDWVVGCSYTGQRDVAGPVRNFIGANMSFRRAPVLAAGGFTEHLGRTAARPLGCEETELCLRLAQRYPDSSLHHLPVAAVTHYVPAERCRWSYFLSRCYAEGQSKAAVAALAGRSPALRTERDYVRTTLPRGVRAALGGIRRDPAGLARATAIVLGLLVTAWGYLLGTLLRPVRSTSTGGGRTASPARWQRGRAAATAALALAIGLWLLALRHVHLDAMDDLGLVSVLPLVYWAALGVVVVGAWILIRRNRARDRTIVAYVVTLIMMLHATPTLLYGSLRYSWAWKHIGIVDYIIRHGAVDPQAAQLSVYHAWPGFFTLGALLTKLSGFHTALSFAAWGPPFFELLDLGPLILLFRTLTTDRRRVWTAVLVYYLMQWVGQDYFSPQAFAFFLYLVCLVVVLRYLERSRRRREVDRRPLLLQISGLERIQVSRGVRRALSIGLVPVMVVIASSHQLTPLVLVLAFAAIVGVGVGGPRWLPWVMAAITIGWYAWLGRTYLAANMQSIVRSLGALESNTGETFVQLGGASVQQQVVDWTDRLLTGLIWPMALAGFLRQRRLDHRESVPALLALVPVPLLATNDYGGEMLFRVCLFATPFLAFLAAGLLQPPGTGAAPGALPSARVGRRRRMPARPAAALSLATILALAAMFVVAYDGKERMNYFTTSERTGSYWLYDTAPKGALITAVNSNYPWAFEHYEYYDYDFLEYLPPRQRALLVTRPLPVMEKFLAAGCTRPTYFILTRSQAVEVRYTASLDPRALPAIVRALRSTPLFRLDYHTRDVDVYQVVAQRCPRYLGGSQ